MALVDSEGFGFSANIADYTNYGNLWIGSATGIGTGGPLGDNYAYIGSYNGSHPSTFRRMLTASYASIFLGVRLSLVSTASTALLFYDSSLGINVSIWLNQSNGQISVYRGNSPLDGGGTLLGSSSVNVVPLVGYFYLEANVVTAGGTSGSVIVRVNGNIVYTLSGVNTAAVTGSTGTAAYGIEQGSDLSGNPMKFAHIYVCDNSGAAPWNTFLGDVRVQTLLPTANDVVQFTPNGLASNWQNAAKVPPVPATDFNADSNVGDQDTFTCAAMASGLTNVFGVTVKALALKSDAGSRAVQTVMKSGATTDLGASTGLGVSALQVKKVYQTDPNTGAQWTQTAVNAAKPGYKVSA